jgi:hypothetical protein
MAVEKLKFGGYLGFGGFLTCGRKFALWVALYIGVFRQDHSRPGSPSLNRTLSCEDSEEIRKGINAVSNARLNRYEPEFGLGLSPNGSDECLLGRIIANGLVERVHTQCPDRPAVAGVLGLGWLGCAAHRVGKAGQAGPTGWILAQESRAGRRHGRRRWGAPSSPNAASFSEPKAPTQSRRWEVSILTTYRGGDGPRTTGD